MAEMVRFCAEGLEEGETPVLLGYSLGKAQEILCALVRAGMTPMLHGAVHRMTEIYRALQPDFPCGYERYAAGQVEGKVLICPPSANRSPDGDAHQEPPHGGADRLGHGSRREIPLRVRRGLPALRSRGLRRPDPLCGAGAPAARAYAARLRLGIRGGFAEPGHRGLGADGSEPTGTATGPRARARAKAAAPTPEEPAFDEAASRHSLAAFAALGEQIAASTSKLRKIELLRQFLAELAGSTSACWRPPRCFLTGKAFPQGDPRVLQAGWAVIKRALRGVSGATEQQLREISHHYADAGKTAHDILAGKTAPEPFRLLDARAFFDRVESTRGPIAKTELLQRQLARLTPLEAKYLVNILTGELRIGLKEGLVEEAIAAAFAVPLAEIKEGNMLLGDIGELAVRAARGTLAQVELRPFTPIKVMLASPEPTAEAIWTRLAETDIARHGTPDAPPPAAWVEDKFDGIRAHLHRGHGARGNFHARSASG